MNFTHDKALLIWPLFNHKIHQTQSTWGHTSIFIPTGPVIWHLTGRVWHAHWDRVKKLNMSGSQAINLIHLLQQKICHDRQAVNCIYIAHLILFWFLSSLFYSFSKCVSLFSPSCFRLYQVCRYEFIHVILHYFEMEWWGNLKFKSFVITFSGFSSFCDVNMRKYCTSPVF